MISYASNFAFKKGRRPDEAGASWLGVTGYKSGKTDGGTSMAGNTRKLTATSFVRRTNLVPILPEREITEEFSAVILPFSSGDLAQIGQRTKEAATGWKVARSLPSAWSLMHMARAIDPVNRWLVARVGNIDPHPIITPQLLEAMIAALYQVAHQPGPDGDAARAALSSMGGRYKGLNKP